MYKQTFKVNDETFHLHNVQALDGRVNVSQLPYTTTILLESLLRNCEKLDVNEEELFEILAAIEQNKRIDIPIVPTRVIMQDASGIPALVDLVSLRQQLSEQGIDPETINPEIPVDLVIDHSVQVDHFRSASAFSTNLALEYERNEERYEFLKWAQQAFDGLSVVPPANGIIHQVNLEYLTKIIQLTETNVAYPELVIGTDSHTTMVNALGVLGWGVGGIEAEAAMLGVPVSMSMPEVVGVEITGHLTEGVTATDIALTVTQLLRQHNVVGKFVEFFGLGLQNLSIPDRATISNMAPEYGATCGFFPVDEETLKFLRMTGKQQHEIERVEQYCKAQRLFHLPNEAQAKRYADRLVFDLQTVEASIAGPKRPQDRMPLARVKESFPTRLLQSGKETTVHDTVLKDGSIVIAAITSCTNTSNPFNMIGAGLLAKKAVALGLTVAPTIQTSLAPGSKVVTGYLQKAGLLPYLEQLGFHLTGYGCSVCVGNSGNLDEAVERAIQEADLTVAAVLSGNRNFEGRIHSLVKANYLASPPLVIAYALAGTMDIDLTSEPIGQSTTGEAVYLHDIWPSAEEINYLIEETISSDLYEEAYRNVFTGDAKWQQLYANDRPIFEWDAQSTYFKASPFFKEESAQPQGNIHNAHVLLMLGDSITTDHISPVGSIPKQSTAGRYLLAQGVEFADFNSYGSRRGNYDVLVRGTFAHLRLKNALSEQTGGYTRYLPTGEEMDIYTAAKTYETDNTPLIILAGKEYGTGSARDWAAKGTYLLGVKAVIAESFERIHRSNLAMMGVLPLQFMSGENAEALQLTGTERYSVLGLEKSLTPQQHVRVEAVKQEGTKIQFQAILRLDTHREIDLYKEKGIFQRILHERKARIEV